MSEFLLLKRMRDSGTRILVSFAVHLVLELLGQLVPVYQMMPP